MLEERDPFAPPAEIDPAAGALVERDPDAAPEHSAEYRITGAASFDDVLRGARWRGFLAGAAVGGVAGAFAASLLAIALFRPDLVSVAPLVADSVPLAAPVAFEAEPVAPARPLLDGAPGVARPPARPARRGAAESPPPRGDAPAAEPVGLFLVASDAPTDRGDAHEGARTPAAAPASAGPTVAGPAVAPQRSPRARDVVAALAARQEALDACVDETPGDDAAARGRRFRMLVVIEPSGRVAEAQAYDDAIAATPLGTCLGRLAKATTFPPFDGEPVRLEVPIRADDGE